MTKDEKKKNIITDEQIEKIIAEEGVTDTEEKQTENDEADKAKSIREDIARLKEIFPSIKANDIPEEVWDKVETGDSLAGAYAFYYLKGLKSRADINRINEANKRKAPPRIRHDGGDESFYTPEEVRNMSDAQVKKHYNAILRSMEKWSR